MILINKTFKLITSFILLSTLLLSENNQINTNFEVEVGIESITCIDNKYNISVYIINPYDAIAGIQFKINPSDIFNIEEVYGGRSEDAGFQIHKNKKGTILGFSLKGETIKPSMVTTGPKKLKDNIVINITASSNKIPVDKQLDMDCVMASKGGKSLSTQFIPFDLSQIVYLEN